MRRIKLVLAALVVMVATFVAVSSPAIAQDNYWNEGSNQMAEYNHWNDHDWDNYWHPYYYGGYAPWSPYYYGGYAPWSPYYYGVYNYWSPYY